MPSVKSKARLLDQFDTAPEIAAACAKTFLAWLGPRARRPGAHFLEPSAGTGVFLDQMPPGSLGMDIDPRRHDVAKGDFLAWQPPAGQPPWFVLGNPPFGKNASLALAFVNHAARFANAVGFILPRTFEKTSMQRRVERHLHLVYNEVLMPEAFVHEGRRYAVPTVFQIWERRQDMRPIVTQPIDHPHFSIVANPRHADFAFQRVGVRAGLVSLAGLAKAPPSHYFVKIAPGVTVNVQAILQAIDWSDIKARTAGNPSIGRRELVEAYTQALSTAALSRTGHATRGGRKGRKSGAPAQADIVQQKAGPAP